MKISTGLGFTCFFLIVGLCVGRIASPKISQTSLPSRLKSVFWAGIHNSEACDETCKKDCLTKNEGEPCIHKCGCSLGSNVVFAVLEDGLVYRSQDGGSTWQNQHDILQKCVKEFMNQNIEDSDRFLVDTAARHIVHSPNDYTTLWILGESYINFVTFDAGETYQVFVIPNNLNPDNQKTLSTALGHPYLHVRSISLHPVDKHHIIALTPSKNCPKMDTGVRCFSEAYASIDDGKKWTFLSDYVFDAGWGNAGRNVNVIREGVEVGYFLGLIPHKPSIFSRIMTSFYEHDRRVYLTRVDPTAIKSKDHRYLNDSWHPEAQFVTSSDLFKTARVMMYHGVRYFFTAEHIYVLIFDDKTERFVLKSSRDSGQTFANVKFTPALHITSPNIEIFEPDYQTVYFHTIGENSYGHLYRANGKGTHFQLSLRSISHDANGNCDLQRVSSLRGVYLANYVTSDADLQNEPLDRYSNGSQSSWSRDETTTTTVITYDNGSTWHPLPTTTDDQDQDSQQPCSESSSCNLHIHTDSTHAKFQPLSSPSNASGLILANGNQGTSLVQDADTTRTYMSTDAGASWTAISKTANQFGIGDHGGLIVLAADDKKTKEVSYSSDGGKTFENLQVTNKGIKIDRILHHPMAASGSFLIIADKINKKKSTGVEGVLIHLDFSESFERGCKVEDYQKLTDESDYEVWYPNYDGSPCTLGMQIGFVRRKPDHECYNGYLVERRVDFRSCECTERDYECDVGFYRSSLMGTCIASDSLESGPPSVEELCAHTISGYVGISRGYHRIAGNSCRGGITHDAIIQQCPETLSYVRSLRYLLMIILICGMLFFSWNTTAFVKVKKAMYKMYNRINNMIFGIRCDDIKIAIPQYDSDEDKKELKADTNCISDEDDDEEATFLHRRSVKDLETEHGL
eukprot:CAMPEP_0115041508 /NCGR_PEP_ID=MMETSP0216-20121206/45562_1 /TAXON_ID=223996 /ORGANISM="Protocruzia adherens, Strain Boccale" /LENGTH=910 /DNA_ID=CAMNT_0002423145 /DNA_START=38 /DNA_END=2773 /DNA_ORIENTATION=+